MDNIMTSDSASSLKYEKTQNRDIVGTIERINRSQKYRTVSEKFLDKVGTSASEFATSEFRQQWRNKHESHENPQGFSIEVSVGSPIYRKGVDDAFHYTMTISTAFSVECTQLDGETQVEAETRMSTWFFENVAQSLNLKVVENMQSSLESDPETSGVSAFTLLQKPESDETGKIGGRKSVDGKINISYMSMLKPKKGELSGSDTVPFKDSEMVRDGLISNISLAFERVKSALPKEG